MKPLFFHLYSWLKISIMLWYLLLINYIYLQCFFFTMTMYISDYSQNIKFWVNWIISHDLAINLFFIFSRLFFFFFFFFKLIYLTHLITLICKFLVVKIQINFVFMEKNPSFHTLYFKRFHYWTKCIFFLI